MRTLLASSALALLFAAPLHAADDHDHDKKRELSSHEHGHVALRVAIDGDKLAVELEAPGESIVGFEHAAENDEQKKQVEAARATLADTTKLFTLTEAAGCTPASSEVELHTEGDHSAFEGEYSFTCSNIAALNSIETKLFTLYPKIEEIDVDYATAAGQGSVELEKGSPVVTLPSTS